ncbi:hypothetical protein EXS65_02575 [Candidatus Peribacteria bacterium]|nr:hypothetical protein [Candidatus Peribacteria bacterium]
MTDPASLINEVRRAIDEADAILLKALAARFRAVRHMRTVKHAAHLETEDRERENILKDLWRKQAEELDIPVELALLILDCVLVESKKIQNPESV